MQRNAISRTQSAVNESWKFSCDQEKRKSPIESLDYDGCLQWFNNRPPRVGYLRMNIRTTPLIPPISSFFSLFLLIFILLHHCHFVFMPLLSLPPLPLPPFPFLLPFILLLYLLFLVLLLRGWMDFRSLSPSVTRPGSINSASLPPSLPLLIRF